MPKEILAMLDRTAKRVPLLAMLVLGSFLAPRLAAEPCSALSFTAPLSLPLRPFQQAPLVGDFNHDGKDDLVILDLDSRLLLYLGRADGEIGFPRVIATRSRVLSLLQVLYFDLDPNLDLLVMTEDGLTVLRGDGASEFQELRLTGLESFVGPHFIGPFKMGDLNGDGLMDIVVAPFGANTLVTLLGDGNGHFSAGPVGDLSSFMAGYYPSRLSLADFDRDGRLDGLLFLSPFGIDPSQPGPVLFIRGIGAGQFGTPRLVVTQAAGSGVDALVGDFDGDGNLDFAVQAGNRFTAWITIYWGSGAGEFTSSGDIPTPQGTGLIWDVDGDGRADLVILAFRNLYVRRGLGGRDFGPSVVVAREVGGFFFADMNGDGRPDFIAGTESASGTSGLSLFLNRCAGLSASRTFVVPATLDTHGVGGAPFITEVTLTNRGTEAAQTELTYTPASGDRPGSAFLTLPAGRQLILPNAIQKLRELGIAIPAGDQIGSLRIRFSDLFSPETVSAQARVLTHSPAGTFGVALPPMPVSAALTETSWVTWLHENAEDRTNLALAHAGAPGDGNIVLRVTVVSTDSNHPGVWQSPDLELSPGSFRQIDRVLLGSLLGAESGYARIDLVQGTAGYFAWAAINDNASADGSLALATTTPGSFSCLAPLPVVVEGGGFETEIVATNTTQVTQTLNTTYYADAIQTTDHKASLSIELAPGAQARLPRFVQSLRQAGTAGIGPAGPVFAGPLDPGFCGTGVSLLARTVTQGTSGRFGTSYGSITPTGSTTWLHGLVQDEKARTNLAIVNMGFGPQVFRIDFFDGDTGNPATSTEVTIERFGWWQLHSVLAGYAPGVKNAWAHVTCTTCAPSNSKFIAYAVVNDGARPGLGTGDGSFIVMQLGQPP
jgi:FG-GAP-like repeat